MAGDLSPRKGLAGTGEGEGRQGLGCRQRSCNTDVSTAPLPTPLLTPSTPGQGQLAGNADPPKIGLFLQCIYYYILIKVAARRKHFYVLWPHRCSTRWFQPSLKSGPSPLVPIKHLLLSVAWRWEGHGVWKAGCLPRKGCAYSLSGRSAAQPAPAPWLCPWSPRASAE